MDLFFLSPEMEVGTDEKQDIYFPWPYVQNSDLTFLLLQYQLKVYNRQYVRFTQFLSIQHGYDYANFPKLIRPKAKASKTIFESTKTHQFCKGQSSFRKSD